MHMMKLSPATRLVGLVSIGCFALASAGWGYGRFVSQHGICVGVVRPELAAHEFSLVPDRAEPAAELLCDRAGDVPNIARLMSAGSGR